MGLSFDEFQELLEHLEENVYPAYFNQLTETVESHKGKLLESGFSDQEANYILIPVMAGEAFRHAMHLTLKIMLEVEEPPLIPRDLIKRIK